MRLDGWEMRRTGVPASIVDFLELVAADDTDDPIWSTAADVAYAVEANIGHVRRVLLEMHRRGVIHRRRTGRWYLYRADDHQPDKEPDE
jgi:DNA-binding IclR family transcriptional regulator